MPLRGLWIGDDWYDDPTPFLGVVAFVRELAQPPKPKKGKRRTIGFTLPNPKKKQKRRR